MNLFQSVSSSCEVISKNQLAISFIRGIAGIGLMADSFVYIPPCRSQGGDYWS